MNGKQLKNSILQWAIQGKLVPQDPNDEPASVLLERIREEKARLVKEKKIKKDKNESIIFRGDDNSHYEKFADGTVKCIDDEIPFEIPQSWCWVRLGAIATIIGGYAFPSESIKSEKGYRVIRISDFNDSKIVYNKVVRYNGDADLTQYEICERDILMAMTGGTVGKSVFLTELPEKHLLLNQRVAIIRNKYIFDEYLNLVITSPITIDVVNSRKNSTNDNISMVDIYNFLVPVPPTNEQKKIVQKIQEALPFVYTYGKSQEALDKLNAEIFDKLKKSVLQEAIQGKLVPQSPDDEPAFVLLERIKTEKAKLFKEGKLKKKDLVDSVIFKGDDNKYYEKIGSQVTCIDDEIPFEIPSSWSWIRLGNYTDVIGGYAFQSQDLKSENGCRVIRISDISEDGLVNTRIVRYSGNLELFQYRIYNSDILMAMTGGTVGKSLLLKSDNKEVLFLNQRVAIIRNTWFDVNYIDTVIKSAYIKSIIDNSKNSTNDNISMADITGFLIPIPPLNEQHRIINKLEFVIASIMIR